MATAKELLEEGKLHDAIQALNGEVKRNPTDIQRRGFLAELLCVTGKLDRADAQLEVIVQQDEKAAVGVALLRQLIRAETARRDFFSSGRLPEFLERVRVLNLRVLDVTIDLLLERHHDDVGITVLRRDGDVQIVAIK